MSRARDNADFGHIAGRRNLLINGDFRINQRAGTRTPGIGVYGYDRWKGHASGLEQVIEQLSLRDGVYTLSWSGGGVGSLDGGASAVSPITATITADHDVSVVVPSNATDVQFELGDKATPFEQRLIGEELALCQRYYQTLIQVGQFMLSMYVGSNLSSRDGRISYTTSMRVPPNVTVNNVTGGSIVGTQVDESSIRWYGSATTDATTFYLSDVHLDAEL